MATITINTNVSAMIAQRSLNQATDRMNQAIERMTTGYKINHAKDNAAGYSIANMWETHLSSLDVAMDNAATGIDLLTTAEETYGLLTDHLQRVRDLTEQAANGTYGSQSLKAIHGEISARLFEINRISANAEFNGIKLMAFNFNEDGTPATTGNEEVGITAAGINLQVGLYADENSTINLAVELFGNASLSGLFKGMKDDTYKIIEDDGSEGTETFENLLINAGGAITSLGDEDGVNAFAAACCGLVLQDDGKTLYLQTDGDYGAKEMLAFLDDAIDEISSRVTAIGAIANRVTSAITALDVQSQNLTSSLSTLRDTDVAEESSNFIQSQILQQSSATLLSTANQLPQMALNLI